MSTNRFVRYSNSRIGCTVDLGGFLCSNSEGHPRPLSGDSQITVYIVIDGFNREKTAIVTIKYKYCALIVKHSVLLEIRSVTFTHYSHILYPLCDYKPS